MLGKRTTHQKNETGHLFYTIHKNNSKWIKDLKVRPKTIKLNFFAFDTKSKNRQVELHQTNKLQYIQGNHQQNKKKAYGMGENICKLHVQ